MTDIVFRRVDAGSGHRYTLNGRTIPGVTTIINKGIPKGALVDWSARLVAEHVADHLDDVADMLEQSGRDSLIGYLKGIPSGDRDKAARRGTEVHSYAHRLAAGEEIDIPEELIGHVDSYLAFAADWQPEDEIIERPVFNRRWNYGGTFDLICTLEPFGRVLIDLKTTRSGIFAETALQLAAYRRAEYYQDDSGQLQPMPDIDHTFALWLRADGYDLKPVDTSDDVFRSFVYVADIVNRFIGRRDLIGPTQQPPEKQTRLEVIR